MASINIEDKALTVGSDGNDAFVFSANWGSAGYNSDYTANTMIGGLGNDFYEVDSNSSVVIEEANGGTDTIRISDDADYGTFSLAANVENAEIGSDSGNSYYGYGVNVSGNDANNTIAVEDSYAHTYANLYGGAGSDKLSGDNSDNTLDGGTGADTLRGYRGDDSYYVDNIGDVVIEDAAPQTYFDFYSGTPQTQDVGGYDTVYSTISYTLGSNVENLQLLGEDNLNGGGNGLDNDIYGNYGNNVLTGLAGDDDLNGGYGNDRLDGGAGDDRLVDDDGDNVLIGGAGYDRLYAGSGNDMLNGDDGDDILRAGQGNNTVNGGAGYDRLYAGYGDDVLDGGLGNDVIIDDGDGSGSNILRGGDGDDLIIANAENGYEDGNTLEGGNGNDILVENADRLAYEGYNSRATVMNGGAGDDQYYVGAVQGLETIKFLDSAGSDTIHIGGEVLPQLNAPDPDGLELDGAGYDVPVSAFTLTLAAGIENVDASEADAAAYLVGNGGNNLMIGSGTTDVLIGGLGNDVLDGRDGADNLIGGIGNDLYVIDDTNDTIVEEGGNAGGIDTVYSTADHKLENSVENLVMFGSDNLSGNGNALDNNIQGNSGINYISGGKGNDTLFGGNDNAADTLWGGDGNDSLTGQGSDKLYGGRDDDTYYVSSASGGIAFENQEEGTDTVIASTDYMLGDHLENLTLAAGTVGWNAAGNDLTNTIKGNDGNNILGDSFGSGAASDNDTLIGGKGNDEYYVTFGGGGTQRDTITELLDGGNDTVHLNVAAHTMGTVNINLGLGSSTVIGLNQIENLDLSEGDYAGYLGTSGFAFSITGSALNNTIAGSSLDDLIRAGAGNDVVYGGAGNDRLYGEAGDDTLAGGNGSNTMEGGVGNDTYFVSSTADTVLENATYLVNGIQVAGGIDTIIAAPDISVSLGSAVENATVQAVFTGVNVTGNAAANVLTGSQAFMGSVTLAGGAGNDNYVIQSAENVGAVSIVETGTLAAINGFDTVTSYVSGYTLAENVEKLVLGGTSDLSGAGNSLANTLVGNSGNNTLDGGAGIDRLEGGAGDDTYYIDTAADLIVDTSGDDTAYYVANGSYTLAANVEDGGAMGSVAINLVGNTLDNDLWTGLLNGTLDGGAGNDYLEGSSGNDKLLGGVGDDELYGNYGNDNLNGGAGNDYLDGSFGTDTLEGGLGDDVYVINSASDLVVEQGTLSGGIDTVLIASYGEDSSYTLAANIENLYADDNSYAVTLVGNNLVNTLVGNYQTNTLDGGTGADLLLGGSGNDTYLVDTGADLVIDQSGDLADTIIATNTSFNLASNGVGVENLELANGTLAVSGFGNELDNTIAVTGSGAANLQGGGGNDTLVGNAAVDTLSGGYGNDTLNGGASGDYLNGGLGDDTYLVDSNSEVIHEAKNEGVDTAVISVDYTLANNVENLEVGVTTGVTGTGNAVDNTMFGNIGDDTLIGGAGNDLLEGGDGNDVLDGGSGLDYLIGGNGDDTYVVDSTGDVVYEADTGIDTVVSSVTYTLADNSLENLVLSGTAAINGDGNSVSNTITGNSGANTLSGLDGNDSLIGGAGNDVLAGGDGNDVLTGGAGNDIFTFDMSGTSAADNINDFVVAEDSIQLDSLVFTGLVDVEVAPDGVLDAADFGTFDSANAESWAASTLHVAYDIDTGNLYYSADGTAGNAQLIATISADQTLTNADILLV